MCKMNEENFKICYYNNTVIIIVDEMLKLVGKSLRRNRRFELSQKISPKIFNSYEGGKKHSNLSTEF